VDLKREFLEMTDVLENLYMAVLNADPDLAKEALKRAGLRNKVKFIIGGAAVSENWAKQICADGDYVD
jgi:methanogenic corrinoid protein MtbC1